MADKKKLKIIAGELRKASAMHKAQAKKIDSMSKGPSMINVAGTGGQSMQPIPPITPPMPDNITGNIGNNFKVQELGKNMFQGEEMANQFAQKQMDKPVPPPGDGIQQQYMQPLSKNGDPKGKAYVVNERPNVWQEGTADRSKDTLWLDNKYKKMVGSYISQTEYDDLARTAYIEGSYKRVNVQDLEDGGKIKIKK